MGSVNHTGRPHVNWVHRWIWKISILKTQRMINESSCLMVEFLHAMG